MLPLTNDKTALHNQINALTAAGSTAGHVGIAWGWYALAPNWGAVWPSQSRPASYSDLTILNAQGQPKLKKIALLMTDGEFNSTYCNGVISQDSLTGSGDSLEHINCNAPNGDSYTQALAQCSSMKAAGIEVFTVGFDVANDANAQNLLAKCAADSSHAYLATDGVALQSAFRDIALKVSVLRLSH